jgi:hypothetical protein
MNLIWGIVLILFTLLGWLEQACREDFGQNVV